LTLDVVALILATLPNIVERREVHLEIQHRIPYSVAMDMLGLIFSFALILVVIAIGFLMSRSDRFTAEFVRKFVHIGVSNWWFILIATFDTLSYALVGPIVFIIANGVAVVTGAADVLGVKDKVRNLGLVYFPISLLLLVLLGYDGMLPMWACGMGAMAMGYGDGLAGLIGKHFGRKKICGGKSFTGTAVMFVVTMLVVIGFSAGYRIDSVWSLSWWTGVVVALLSAALEAFTPFGLDNITVPLGTAALAYLMLGVL
jgi:phytol kinase